MPLLAARGMERDSAVPTRLLPSGPPPFLSSRPSGVAIRKLSPTRSSRTPDLCATASSLCRKVLSLVAKSFYCRRTGSTGRAHNRSMKSENVVGRFRKTLPRRRPSNKSCRNLKNLVDTVDLLRCASSVDQLIFSSGGQSLTSFSMPCSIPAKRPSSSSTCPRNSFFILKSLTSVRRVTPSPPPPFLT